MVYQAIVTVSNQQGDLKTYVGTSETDHNQAQINALRQRCIMSESIVSTQFARVVEQH